MAEYSKIYKKIWNNKRFRSLSEDARTLYLYFLTSPHSNSIGFYRIDMMYIMADLQWDRKRLQEPLRELFRNRFVTVDEDERIVLILSWFEHNSIQNLNQCKKAEANLSEVCNCKLIKEFLTVLKPLPKPYRNRLETVCQTVSNPEAETESNIIINNNRGKPLKKREKKTEKKRKVDDPDYYRDELKRLVEALRFNPNLLNIEESKIFALAGVFRKKFEGSAEVAELFLREHIKVFSEIRTLDEIYAWLNYHVRAMKRSGEWGKWLSAVYRKLDEEGNSVKSYTGLSSVGAQIKSFKKG